jgi:hypothetical protein
VESAALGVLRSRAAHWGCSIVTGRTGGDRESGSPEPFYDHHAVHVVGPGTPAGNLHADVVIDTRAAFDVNPTYYPQRVLLTGGPTLVVPGSHFRQINGVDIARYQNLAGQVFLA